MSIGAEFGQYILQTQYSKKFWRLSGGLNDSGWLSHWFKNLKKFRSFFTKTLRNWKWKIITLHVVSNEHGKLLKSEEVHDISSSVWSLNHLAVTPTKLCCIDFRRRKCLSSHRTCSQGGAEITRPDKTAPYQTARLNNGGHEQSSPWRIITAE